MTPYLLLLIAICLSVSGELLLKYGMNQVGALPMQPSLILQGLVRTFSQPTILLGFVLIFSGSIFWLAVISRVHLSYAYPMLSLGYILVVALSWAFLKESVTAMRFMGVLVICAGVFLVSRS
ncbi:MAG: EamA family transporter [Chloroflexi bacterium]|nr:EamA family transporter [Chloroflexota bacterium]MCL5025333.1 EamA family transporter [Chloroflexota bacterium]